MSTAIQDLDFIKQVVQRTDRRIDPHAFHYVHWGLIVLIWYLANHLNGRVGKSFPTPPAMGIRLGGTNGQNGI